MRRLLLCLAISTSALAQTSVTSGGTPVIGDPAGGQATVSASSVATAITSQTGCTTAGYVWVPASNSCVAAPSPTASSLASAIASQTGCTTAGFVWVPATNACVAAAPAVPATDTQAGYQSVSDHTAQQGVSPVSHETTTGSLDGVANLIAAQCPSPLIPCYIDVPPAYGDEFNSSVVPKFGNEGYTSFPMIAGKVPSIFLRNRQHGQQSTMILNPRPAIYDLQAVTNDRHGVQSWCRFTNRIGQADNFGCNDLHLRIHDNLHNYILPFVTQKSNHYAIAIDSIVTASGQGGGGIDDSLLQTAPGDDMVHTTQHNTFGFSESEDEHTKADRMFLQSSVKRWGGTLTAAPTDPLGIGRYALNVSIASGYSANQSGSDLFVVNLQRPYTTGNMTFVGKDSTYPALALMHFDAAANIVPQFGTSSLTTLTATVDNLVDAGTCPRTGIGAASSPDLSVTDESGRGGKLFCGTFGSTSGIVANHNLVIAGQHSNFEIVRIATVVDATHATWWGQLYHDVGEVASTGGLAGYAVCPTADTITTTDLPGWYQPPSIPLPKCWPFVGNDASGNVHVYIDSAAYNEFSTLGYANTTPLRLATVSGTTLSGTGLSAINFSDTGEYSVDTSGLLNSVSSANVLAAPTIAISSATCSMQPTAITTLAYHPYGYYVVASITSPGVCSAAPLASEVHLQTTWPNPFQIVPLTIARKVLNPATGKVNDGYLMTDSIKPSDWLSGDMITEPTWLHDDITSTRVFGKYFTKGTGNTHSVLNDALQGIYGGDTTFYTRSNQALGQFYYPDATHPRGPKWGSLTAPGDLGSKGAWSTFYVSDLPPQRAAIEIFCYSAVYHPCSTGATSIFDLLHLKAYNGLPEMDLSVSWGGTSPLSSGLSWNGYFAAGQLIQSQDEIAIPYSAAPALDPVYRTNTITLTGLMSPTITAGTVGQQRVCLRFVKPSTSTTYAITYPANMLGGGQPLSGYLRAKQCYDWTQSANAFEIDGPMMNF